MLIGDPPPTQGELHFSLFGIPVRVHPFFWLVGLLLTARSLMEAPGLLGALRSVVPWLAAFFFAILVHELGHALAMRVYGFAPSITLYALGGFASYGPAADYRSKGSRTLSQILICAAGPGAGFLLAGAISGAIFLSGHEFQYRFGMPYLVGYYFEEIGSPLFTTFLYDVLFICIFWGIINLLPVYPLDGGQIAREVLLAANIREGVRQSLILSIVTGVVVAVYALAQLESWFMAFMFGYLAFASYQTLQAYTARRGW